jgi:hypothetical protein
MVACLDTICKMQASMKIKLLLVQGREKAVMGNETIDPQIVFEGWSH